MPVWIPPRGEDGGGLLSISIQKALAQGLTFRSLSDTTQATLDWFKSQPADRQAKMRAGITAEREAQVLAAWHAKSQSA